MKWRKLNHLLHRDIGYLCVGLTIIYAVSGITLNHISPRFNPNYQIEKSTASVAPMSEGTQPDMQYIATLLKELGETGQYKSGAFVSPRVLRVFVEGNTIDVYLDTGIIEMEKVIKRPILYEINSLHLNKLKGVWTWFADVYCIALFIVALTGGFMIRGKQKTRHLSLVLVGFLIPLYFVFLL
ncbi:PepSY-associated TM helix domain-containing protein [Desulforhopalus sp. 52FAK]